MLHCKARFNALDAASLSRMLILRDFESRGLVCTRDEGLRTEPRVIRHTARGTFRLKQAVYSVVANTGLICLGTGAVLLIPAFATDAYFWLSAAVAAQIWMCCIRRVGR